MICSLPWDPKTFILGVTTHYIGGLKPSFFMVLGSKGKEWSLFSGYLKNYGVYVLTNHQRSQIHTFKLFFLEHLMWSLILFRPSSQHLSIDQNPCDIPLH